MRFVFAWMVAAVVVGCADPSGELAGERAAIYHGVRETGEPWVVAVSYLRPGTTRIGLCTGSVIAPGAVLTAKHCVFDEVSDGVWEPLAPAALTVTVTSDYRGTADAERGVTAIATTPGVYTRAGAMAGNDIAVLTLDTDLAVAPVPYTRIPPATGADVHIAGFGFTETDELGVKHSAMPTIDTMNDGVFVTTGESWTCTGDSGGPARDVATGALVGVTSYGPSSCSTPESYFTRIDRHVALIDDALGVTGPPPPADAGGPDVGGTDAGSPPSGTDAGGAPPPPMMMGGGRRDGGCAVAPGTTHTPAALAALFALVLALCARLFDRKARV